MFSLLSLGLFATPLLILILTITIIKYQIRNAKSPLRQLPGPPSQSWLYGNLKYILESGQSAAWDEWMATYGKTFRYPSTFNVNILSWCPQLCPMFMIYSLLYSLQQIPER